MILSNDDLRAALVGYHKQREEIDTRIAAIKAYLEKTLVVVQRVRNLSPEARQRIAAAQRKRWKLYHDYKKAS